MKRRRVWLWLLASLGVVLAALAAIVWDVHRRADVVIERHRQEAERLLAEYRSRDFRRPPLEGEGAEGNAWDLYALHLPVIGSLPPDEEAEIPEVDGTWEPDRRPDDEVLDVLYLKYAPQIEGLREALQRRVVDTRTDFAQGNAAELPPFGPTLKAARFLAGGIAHHHRLGRGREAGDLAAIGLGLAQDQRPAIIGLLVRVVVEGSILASLRETFADHRWSAGDLERFAGLLDRLDVARPTPADAWDSEELFIRFNLVSPAWTEPFWDARALRRDGPGWRQLWSWKVARAQALARFPRYLEEGRHALALPPPARVVEANRLLQEWERGTQPVLTQFSPMLMKAIRSDVESLAQRTLLQVSVALARHEMERGAFPAKLDDLVPRYLGAFPACPYSGKPLGYLSGKVWSPGADGVDNGGTEDPSNPERFDNAGFDVVWTVKRRKP